jgi:hypothetical protein
MGANARVHEVEAIGRILADFNNLEIGLLGCLQNGIDDFDQAFKTIFGKRGESQRIKDAVKLGQPSYQALGLDADFTIAVSALRHALQIRNQYAHWTWWDDHSGQLALANLEDLARDSRPVGSFEDLKVNHVDMPLLRAQEEYFVYIDRYFAWLISEVRFLKGKARLRSMKKPSSISPPLLHH